MAADLNGSAMLIKYTFGSGFPTNVSFNDYIIAYGLNRDQT